MKDNNIIDITSEGLTYMDENGERQFIDFVACNQRYLEGWSDPACLKRFKELNPTINDEQLEASVKLSRTLKEIGGRDSTIPYIELYTDTPTRFYFSNRDEYDKAVYLIKKAGWRLFDRS